jgi:hypothetical protein
MTNPKKRIFLAIILFALSLGLLTAGIHLATAGNTLGTDFYIYWLAGRMTFIDHGNPYSDALNSQAQLAIYKRPATPSEDQLGFAYPLFALLPVLPTLWMDFGWAQALWMAISILALISSVIFLYPTVPKWILVAILAVYPFSFGLILGNFDILLAAIMLFAYKVAAQLETPSQRLQVVAGIVLAWAACKPQFTWLFIIFFLVAALKNHLVPLMIAFFASLAAMLAGSFLIFPGWPQAWYDQFTKYQAYNQTWVMLTFYLRSLFSLQTSIMMTASILLILVPFTVILFKTWWKNALPDLRLFAWCAFLIFLTHPRGKSYEQIVFLIPMIVWLTRLKSWRTWRVTVFSAGTLVISWAVIIAAKIVPAWGVIIEWPFFFYLIWMTWLFNQKIPQATNWGLSIEK